VLGNKNKATQKQLKITNTKTKQTKQRDKIIPGQMTILAW
jgi:hypothetical protein